jgi:hypothetical protein
MLGGGDDEVADQTASSPSASVMLFKCRIVMSVCGIEPLKISTLSGCLGSMPCAGKTEHNHENQWLIPKNPKP